MTQETDQLTDATQGNDRLTGTTQDNEGQTGMTHDNEGHTGTTGDNDGQTGLTGDNDGQTGTKQDNDGQTGTTQDNDGQTGTTQDSDGQTCVTQDNDGQTGVTQDNDRQTGVTLDNDGQTGVTQDNDGQTCVTQDNDGQTGVTQDNDRQTGVTQDNDGQTGMTQDNDGQTGMTLDNDGQTGVTLDNDGQTGVTQDNEGQTDSLCDEGNKAILYAHEVVFGSTDIKEANYLFTCCEGIKLTRNSLRFIKDKLSDEIIDSYMLTLFRTTASSYEYIPCAVMSMMLNKRSQPAVIDHDFVSNSLGVYNVGRKHWVLIIIKLAKKQLVVVDPLGELQSTLNYLFSSWVHYLKLKGESITPWNVATLDHVKQQDSISCGVFCLMFAQKYVSGQTLDFDPDTVELFRSHILQTILENPDETLILKLCRICLQEEPRGRKKDKDIDWVGCERCGMYWCHFQCMGTSEPLCSFLLKDWFCRFCC